jgi:hypothetical protein
MSNSLKFTGTFKNLKGLGCEFMKLYAMNYKVYLKEIGGRAKFWVWVAEGGYIEFADMYDNTKNFIEGLQSINWDEIEGRPFFGREDLVKIRYVRYNHGDASKGFKIFEESRDFERTIYISKKEQEMGLERMGLYKEEYSEEYEKARKFLDKDFDSEFMVTEESAKEILEVYEQLQNS